MPDSPPPPPSPTPIESGGTYARSFGLKIYPYLGYWSPLTITKKHPLSRVFLGKLSEYYAPKYSPFPRKYEDACGPLMHSTGGGGGGPYSFPHIL